MKGRIRELWDPPLWCDVLGRSVHGVGCVWFSGIVDYTDSISHGVSNKELRPELGDFGVFFGLCVGTGFYD